MKITPAKKISGTIALPGDKSISHRAVMIASLARGTSRIENFLTSLDCLYTLKAFQALGVQIESSGTSVTVKGKGAKSLKAASEEIYLGNSGTSMRLIAGVLAAQQFQSILTGDESLSARPMDRIIKPLGMMGAEIIARSGKYPPLKIKGGTLKPIQYESPVASAQVKSAVMLAALYADGRTTITEPARSRDHTEKMLGYFGADVKVKGLAVSVKGPAELKSAPVTIPGDISSAAFFIVLATLLKNSEIQLSGILHNPTRAGFIEILKKMGAAIEIKNIREVGPEQISDITVKSASLKAIKIGPESIPRMIDELPVLMVAASLASGRTEIRGAAELRVKETDRINSMAANLAKMGVEIRTEGNDINIEGTSSLRPAELESFGDHRTAMSVVIAALTAESASKINGADCINTSFPGFFEALKNIKKS